MQVGVDRRDDRRLQAAHLARQPPRGVPGEGRKGITPGRQGLGHGFVRLNIVDGVGVPHARQDQVARKAGAIGMTVGAACLGRLRHRDQQRLFAQRQAFRFMAEIAQRRGAHALEIAAIGRQAEIEAQDLRLGVAQLQLQGAQGFDRLVAVIARVRRQQARRLHGDGRAARDDMAHVQVGQERAQDGGGVDAGVPPEALVLDLQQVANIIGIGAFEIRPQTPAAVIDRQGTQPGAVVVDHDG